MTDETVDAVLNDARSESSAADYFRFEAVAFSMPGGWRGLKRNPEYLRLIYESLLPKTADVSRALVGLSACFTDFNGCRWRRHEDESLEILAQRG
jgi:hypothetical protein